MRQKKPLRLKRPLFAYLLICNADLRGFEIMNLLHSFCFRVLLQYSVSEIYWHFWFVYFAQLNIFAIVETYWKNPPKLIKMKKFGLNWALITRRVRREWMTVRWTVRAAEQTAAFSQQRKCKTGGSSPPSATKERQSSKEGCFSFVWGRRTSDLWNGVPEQSQTVWGKESQRSERAHAKKKIQRGRERYAACDDAVKVLPPQPKISRCR